MTSSLQDAPRSNCYEVPVRFVSSHGIESPGFQSRRQGFFWRDDRELGEKPFSFENGDVLDTPLRRLSLLHRGNEGYLLALDFFARAPWMKLKILFAASWMPSLSPWQAANKIRGTGISCSKPFSP
jgi:hypothetical protein